MQRAIAGNSYGYHGCEAVKYIQIEKQFSYGARYSQKDVMAVTTSE